MDKYSALYRYFGHTAFRFDQEKLIDAILAGRDVMGIMPTGSGKSLCYQIPALLLPGVTLVISPLHFPVGAGFPPQLSAHRGLCGRIAPPSGIVRLYRHRHGGGAAGYRAAPAAE